MITYRVSIHNCLGNRASSSSTTFYISVVVLVTNAEHLCCADVSFEMQPLTVFHVLQVGFRYLYDK